MGDYQKLVKTEAKSFFDANYSVFLEDAEEFGGKTEDANFVKWLDKNEKLNEVVETKVSGWATKDFHWVHSNSRNAQKSAFGDPRSNAYGSYYADLLQELKKLKKKSPSARGPMNPETP